VNVDSRNFLFSILFSINKIKKLPKPNFIIGAGHKTHASLLYLKFIFGGKTILIMKPSLPSNWFDLCIIPEHDNFEGASLIYKIKGALANTSNLINKDEKKGIILVGGISKHYEWGGDNVVRQIEELLINNPLIHFILSPSRRTPKDFIVKINKLSFSNLTIHSIQKQNKDWLKNQMNKTKYAWITEDSISMIYESLTAGQNVGLIALKSKYKNRITNEIERLKKEKIIFANTNRSYKNINESNFVIDEATRCAKLIKKQFIEKVKK
jgi:mitochondrial fission protein ELM1